MTLITDPCAIQETRSDCRQTNDSGHFTFRSTHGSAFTSFAEKNPIATALYAKYKEVQMPNLRLEEVEVEALVHFLETQAATHENAEEMKMDYTGMKMDHAAMKMDQ